MVVRIPTLLISAIKGTNMVPHHILALVLAVADIMRSPSFGLGTFYIYQPRRLLLGESENCIAIMAAQGIQLAP